MAGGVEAERRERLYGEGFEVVECEGCTAGGKLENVVADVGLDFS